MWLFCKSGFFSAVQHAQNPGVIHLRARFKGDLERLFAEHGVNAQITETPLRDYRFRADLKKADWTRIVAAEADAIDYTNFKNAVHDGTERDWAYMDVWTAMRGAQEDAR